MIYFFITKAQDQRQEKMAFILNEYCNQNEIKFNLIMNEDHDININCNKIIIKLNFIPGKKYFYKLINLLNVKKIINKINIYENDIVICDGLLSLYYFINARIFNCKCKLVYYVSDIPNDSFDNKNGVKYKFMYMMVNVLEKLLLKKVYAFLLTSKGFFDYYKIENKKYFIIENKPSKNNFNQLEINNKTNCNNNEIVIGYFGSLRYKEITIRFIKIALLFNIKILIAGTCDYLDDIIKFKNVTYLGSYKYDDINKLYNKVNFNLALYDNKIYNVTKALPNKLYESILFEKPIIVSKFTYLSEVIEQKRIGYTVDPYSEKDINNFFEFILSEQGKKDYDYKIKKLKISQNSVYFESDKNSFFDFLKNL